MGEVLFYNEDFRTGFSFELPVAGGISAKIAGASHEFTISLKSRKNFGSTGFSPERTEQFMAALRDRREAQFTGQTIGDGFIWGDKLTVTPKANGKVELRVTECGNAPATATLTCDDVDRLVASLEALWVMFPTDTIRLLGHMNEDGDERFWSDNPTLRAEIENMILEKRYSNAFNTYHTNHQRWFKTVREPEIVGQPITEGRRRAIDAILKALREDN